MLTSPVNARPGNRSAILRWSAALVVGAAALLLYRATLLPGVDFGDSGSIQTTVGSTLLTPRNGYPLYFAIGAAFLRLTGATPAYAMNLASAAQAAVACAIFVLVAEQLTGSIAAAAAGSLLFAVSYTFWSQAVTAEVYALHLCFVLGSLFLILRWEEHPSTGRLAAFFACYAAGFGNHLSMILLLPAFVVFLFTSELRGWRALCSPRVVILAAGFAALGAAQYLWNLRTLWFQPDPPLSLWAAVRTFWFDVTKSDWRDTMVLNVPQTMVGDHAAMYWFDVRQQFGIAAIALAVLGAVAVSVRAGRRAILLGLIFVANTAFAFGYNVGDTHVFYLPSHVVVALFAACGIADLSARVGRYWRLVPAGALVLLAAVRGYRDYPALDRSHDVRAADILTAFTSDLDDQHNIALVDLNWQIANGLSYAAKVLRPQAATVRVRDVLLYAPALIRDNVAAGRDVVLTAPAAAVLNGSYGPLIAARADRTPPPLNDTIARVPRGTRFVLCVLKPTRDFAIDEADLNSVLNRLQVSRTAIRTDEYAAVAGVIGEPPRLLVSAERPFTRQIDLDGVSTEIRMESWLSADTIRRMGFGHVVANHQHTMIVERGVSFVAFDGQGRPRTSAYVANIFAPLPRLRIPATGATAP